MDIINSREMVKQKKIPAQTVLILQGQVDKAFYFLHSGLAELLSYSGEPTKKPEEMLRESIRVGLIKGESIVGIMGLRQQEPYQRSVRAMTDCIISVFPVSTDDIIKKLQSDMNLNLQVLRALVQRVDSGIFLLNNYQNLWHRLAVAADSIALGGGIKMHKTNPDTLQVRAKTPLVEYASRLKAVLAQKHIKEPEEGDPNLLLGEIQDRAGLYNDIKGINVEKIIDNQQYLFFKRLLRKPNEVLTALFKNDEPTNYYIFQFLNNTLELLLKQNENIVLNIRSLVDVLFTDKGWISAVLGKEKLKNNRILVFNHYLSKFCVRFRKDIIQLLGRDLQQEYSVYTELSQFINFDLGIEADEEDKFISAPVAVQTGIGGSGKYKNLLKRILDFAEMEDGFNEEITALLRAFKNVKDKFENEPKINKLKAKFADKYWELYETCFLKVIDTDLKSFVPGIMLHFGLLDETLVSEEDLKFIGTAYARNLFVESPVPVLTLPYFLEKIYKQEINPSLTQMGASFTETLKKQLKMSKKEIEYYYRDTVEDRVKFEIKKIIADTSRLVFGSTKTSFPILCRDAMLGTSERLFMEPQAVADLINTIRQKDFSLFFREVVIHHKYGSDIVLKEIIPNFVLYPLAGKRMIMWQELDGSKRDSRGRAFLPVFCNEDRTKSILSILGHFRWELQRIIAGAKWMDAVEGGLVGSYYDYINFYKKNPNLSPEAKEDVKNFIGKTRSDRDRFTIDYYNWMQFEYEGRIKLNKVARDIFYRFCPFPRAVREELSKKPIFQNFEMKYQNRARKNILKMESRLKKFDKSEEQVPQELSDYLEFLKR